MATWYYDYGTSSTTSGSTTDYWSTTSDTRTSWGVWICYVRRYLIDCPVGWTQDVVDAFVRLVNCDTKTGWRVTMVIRGDICITDPTLERRTMAAFLALWRWDASAEDKAKIDEFFKAHPAEEPKP